MKKILCYIILTCIAVVANQVNGQNWQQGDSLKTISSDTNRIDQFRDNVIDWTGQDLVDASFPNSWPLFGSKARMAIGGFVKLDYIQDFNGSYDRYQYEIQNVPIDGDGRVSQSGYMNMHARESRVNIDVRNITESGMPLRVFFEFDFYNLDRGPFNQSARLRHFYGVLGRLLIGRTWGTQTDLFAVPSTIDFAAGDALTGIRRAQVRFEDKLNKDINYAFALEMLEFPGIDGNGFDGQESMLLPTLVGRITKNTSSGGRLFLGASAFQLRWDGLTTGPDATAFGWGISFSGREYFGQNKHYFRWMSSYGQGWGCNIVATIGSTASAILTPDEKLETMPAWNLGGGFAFNLSPILTANINTNWFGLSPSDYRDLDKIKLGGSGHVNLIWAPYESVNTGIEFMTLYRENGDGKSGIGNRLQIMFKYLF
ncbi:DcaP family trimeric outer membrane transporter [Carboxylicivirga linearis]|uniref:Porin n=1 Tax=Carboxylicivirga linearis TaxID=1628157 RepID=A0ABS5K236_9BACT|nr:DcaP family trimeric outer membrane transporter [Carboxylicivirga linearis]MBS2101120.1 hypothetical protein [Carboxylicivirga linearis]